MRRKDLTDDVPQVVPVVCHEFLISHGQQLAVQRREVEGCWLRLFYVSHCHSREEFPCSWSNQAPCRSKHGGENPTGSEIPLGGTATHS